MAAAVPPATGSSGEKLGHEPNLSPTSISASVIWAESVASVERLPGVTRVRFLFVRILYSFQQHHEHTHIVRPGGEEMQQYVKPWLLYWTWLAMLTVANR
jgi:hypothetical protein